MVFSRSRVATLLGVLLGLALTSTMVVRTTQAVFNNTTQTSSNGWSTGGAAITNDYAATAPFSVATDNTLTGGQTLQKCLVVTYNGTTVPASVTLSSGGRGSWCRWSGCHSYGSERSHRSPA